MTPRVLIPTEDQDGKVVAAHFGRAPFFNVVDIDDNGAVTQSITHPNTGSHRGGMGHAHDNVLMYSPNVVIVSGMGPRGIRGFQDASIAVLKANSSHVEAVLQSYLRGTLSELTEGCVDAHHK